MFKEEDPRKRNVRVCVRVSNLRPIYGSLPHGQGRTTQGGGHLTGYRWQQQTDRDTGDINALINNYPNNDTRYIRVGGKGTGWEETGLEDIRENGKMRRGF